ncbi:acetyl-CoA carboxylase biotin carboxyl carrier protein [Acidobacteriota bacterium]
MRSKIDYEEITKLINLMEKKDMTEFELELQGFKIKISRGPKGMAPLQSIQTSLPTAAEGGSAASAPEKTDETDGLHIIKSPMVGTFYRSSDPTSPPFADIGEDVTQNQTVCILEAMKLMNEIESDIDGVVEEIYVENGKPVEYGQKLFGIRPN